MRLLAYEIVADAVDEKIGIAESTTLMCFERFCQVVTNNFEDEYSRSPTIADTGRILTLSSKRGFLCMIGSIDCSKWVWRNCPKGFHGQFKGKKKSHTVTLKAICDQSLWIWHEFPGMPGCLNNINVVEASSLSQKIANREYSPALKYIINGVKQNKSY